MDNLEATFTDAKNDNRLVPILIIGVNGSGKTTTIGKLANYFQRQNFTVALAVAILEQLLTTINSVGCKKIP